MKKIIVRIIYTEGDQSTYKCVELNIVNDSSKMAFNTGDFVKDWFQCMKYITMEEEPDYMMLSSVVDHFITDGDKYISAYLKSDHELHYEYDFKEPGMEFFVPKDKEMTWVELKEYSKDDNNSNV